MGYDQQECNLTLDWTQLSQRLRKNLRLIPACHSHSGSYTTSGDKHVKVVTTVKPGMGVDEYSGKKQLLKVVAKG